MYHHSLLLVAAAFFALFNSSSSSSNLNLKPKQIIDAVRTVNIRFGGPPQSPDRSEHFKLLEADGESLLVGAKNVVYNLSISSLGVHHKIEWSPPADVVEECLMKGKLKGECQNFIRVLARQSQGKALICGTHAFSPKCREYVYDNNGGLTNKRQFDGQGISPFDPRDNSTAVYVTDTNEIYSGTVSNFDATDALIYRKKILEGDKEIAIRTQRDDIRVFNAPNFVASFVFREHVYFWFRERAVEVMDNNEEKQIYARVARVCKNDKGGARPANEKWTSFLKARVNCSLPGASPFYFNELKSVTDPVSIDSDHIVYAVFSTPDSSVRMSAVCSFSMNKIRTEFDTGTFKYQKTTQSMWVGHNRNDIPKPRPGLCVPDSTKLPDTTISFILHNPIMAATMESIGSPIIIEGSERAHLTQIAVLPNVKSVNGDNHTIIFIGTSDGRVLKVIESNMGSTLIQSTQIFKNSVPVVNLLTRKDQLVVVSSDEIITMNVHNCEQQTMCSKCVGLHDPHCAWDQSSSRCVHRKWNEGVTFIQNVILGRSEQCPEGILNDFYEEHEEPSIEATLLSSSNASRSIWIGASIAILVALVIGAALGYIVRDRFLREAHHSASSTSGSDYDSFGRARLTRHDSLTTAAKIEHVYGGAPKSLDGTSMVLQMPSHSMSVHPHSHISHAPMSISQHGSGATTPSRDKNAILTSINQNTLPRDYKVKKVYL